MPEVLLINAAYMLLLTAAFTRALRHVRLLLIGGALFFVAYGAATGIWSMVAWNVVIGGVNASRLFRDWRSRRAISLTAEERQVRDDFLPGSSDFDFYALWCMGTTVRHESVTLIGAGTTPTSVSMILEGVVEIRRDGVVKLGLRRGGLIGEMSYVHEDAATVDVVAAGSVLVHEWDQRQLRTLEQTHPPAANALNQLIARDLVAKNRV